MNNKKILIGLLLALVFTAVNCFAGGLIVENPYIKHIEIQVKNSKFSSKKNDVDFSLKGKGHSFTPGEYVNAPTYYNSLTFNEIEVSVGFKDPKTGSIQLIDKKEFKADTGGTNGKQTYKKEFLVGGKEAWVKYALNVEFSQGMLKAFEVVILQVSIPGVKKTEL